MSPGDPLPQRDGSHFEPAEPASSRGAGLSPRSPFEPFNRHGEYFPEPGDSQSHRGAAFPQRDVPPHNGGDALPHRGDALPQRGMAAPTGDGALPQRGMPGPTGDGALPQRGMPGPTGDGALPQRGQPLPQRRQPLPQRGQPLAERTSEPGVGEALPQRGQPLPQRGQPLPQRGEQPGGPDALPRRTIRTRPSGRHRSPHRLSVASDAPALVLAVPGSAEADMAEIGPRVASIAGLSCPGVEIRVGYVEGDDLSLAECLVPSDASAAEQDQFPSVIVPLLLGPSPSIDAILRRLATLPAIPAVVAGHLGPHPLVAEALHARLAEPAWPGTLARVG